MRLRLPVQLPQLSGPVLAIYRIAWPVLFLLGLVSTVYLSPAATMSNVAAYRAFYETGVIALGLGPDGHNIGPFTPESRAVGVRRHDLLVAIDGRPAPIDYTRAAAMLARPDGAPVRLTVRGQDGAVRDVTLHRDRAFLDSTYARVGLTYEGRQMAQLAIGTIGSLLGLLVAALLYLRRKRDPVAALLALSATVTTISVGSLTGAWASPATQELLLRAASWIAIVALALALLVFPSGRFSPRWSWLGVPMILLYAGLIQAGWNNDTFDVPGAVTMVIALALVVAVIVTRYRAETAGVAKQQIKYAILGVALMAILFTLSTLCYFPQLRLTDEGVIAWMRLGQAALWSLGYICLQLGLLVSLLRFRLYDAETAISRSTVVASLTLFLGFIFVSSEKLFEAFGQSYFGEEGRSSAAVLSAVLAATLIAPLHGRVHRWAERRFQKALIALREGLPALVGDLRETATPERLADIALERVETGVRSTRGVIVLGERVVAIRDIGKAEVAAWRGANPLGEENGDSIHDADDPLFPVRVSLNADGCGRVGWLLLGPRPDGTLFGKDEREALTDIADPLARALAISAAREQDTTKRQRELGRLRTLVTALETRLATVEVKLA